MNRIPTQDVTGDYSCGNCGWWGYLEDCIFEPEKENDLDGDGSYVCPKCGNERVGVIQWKDFEKYNVLHGCTWRGEKYKKQK